MDRINVNDIEKWRSKILSLIDDIGAVDNKSEEMLNNMKAYVSDSNFFLAKGDLVRSFEALVFAYGILETCKELGVFINR